MLFKKSTLHYRMHFEKVTADISALESRYNISTENQTTLKKLWKDICLSNSMLIDTPIPEGVVSILNEKKKKKKGKILVMTFCILKSAFLMILPCTKRGI